MAKRSLTVFVKEPVPGKVKTRLVPPMTKTEAAELYRSWAREIFGKVRQLGGVRVQVAYEPLSSKIAPDWLSENGEEVPFFLQCGSNLGERMKNAFEKSFTEGFDSAILIGSDSPGLPLETVAAGFEALETHDVVLGPTPDGGYYLIGLKNKFPGPLFDGIEWSSKSVLERTRKNAGRLALRSALLPEYFDIDRPEDLAAYQDAHIRP